MDIEKLEIKIQSNSSRAASALTKLENSIKSLRTTMSKLPKDGMGLGKISTELKKIKEDIPALVALSGTIKMINKTLKEVGNTQGFTEVSKQIRTAAQDTVAMSEDMVSAKSKIELLPSTLDRMARESREAASAAIEHVDAIRETGEAAATVDTQFSDRIIDNIVPAIEKTQELKTSLSGIKPILSGVGSAFMSSFGVAKGILQRVLSTLWQVARVMGRVAAGFARATISTGRLALGFRNVNEQAGFMNSTIGKALKSIVLYRFMRGILTQILRAFRDGTRNIAQFSERANAAMSSLITNTMYLRNSLAAMAAPAIEALVPLFNTVTDAIVRATNAIGMFIAAITGQGFFVRARRSSQDYLDTITGGAAAAAREVDNLTGGIDELNVLQDNANNAGGGDSGPNIGDMFETVEIPESIRDFATALRDAFMNQDFDWFYDLGYMLGRRFTDALQMIPWDFIQEWANATVRMVAYFLNGAVDGADWSVIGYTIGQAINTVFGMMHTWYTNFDFHNFGTAIAEAINYAIETTDFDLIGSTLAEKLNATIRFLAGIVENLEWASVGDAIAEAINAFFRDLDFERLTSGINAFALGLVDAVTTLVGGVDWSGIGEKIAETLNDIRWNDIISSAGTMAADILNAIVDTIATFAATFNFSEIGTSIAAGINSLLNRFDFAALAQGASSLARGLLNTIISFLRDMDWRQLGESIRLLVSNIDLGGFIADLAMIIVAAIDGAFDIVDGFLNGNTMRLANSIATMFAGFKVGGPIGAAVAGAVTFIGTYLVDGLVNQLSRFVVYAQTGVFQTFRELEAETQALAEHQEYLLKRLDRITAQVHASAGSWGAVAFQVADAWGVSTLEVVRYAEQISQDTRNMLDPFIDRADDARVALLNLFLEGRPVVESDTLQITGYIREMASTAVDQLRRMKDAALENLAFVFGEEAVDFERRMSEATRFYDDRIAEIDREMRRRSDAVRELQLNADEEKRIHGEVTAETAALLEQAKTSEREYSDSVAAERQRINEAREEELQRVRELFPNISQEYLELRDNVKTSLQDQFNAVTQDTQAMRDTIAENMRAGQSLSLESLNEMTSNLEAFTQNGISLLVRDGVERESILHSRNDSLLAIDTLAGQRTEELLKENIRAQHQILSDDYVSRATHLRDHWSEIEGMTEQQASEMLAGMYSQFREEKSLLEEKYADFLQRSREFQDENLSLTFEGAEATGAAMSEGYLASITAAKDAMREAWSDNLLAALEAGDVAIERTNPSEATKRQGISMNEGIIVGIQETTSEVTSAVDSMMEAVISSIESASSRVQSAFSNIFSSSVMSETTRFSSEFVTAITRTMTNARQAIQNAQNPITSLFRTLFTNIRSETTRFSNDMQRTITDMMTAIQRTIQNASNPILTLFRTLYQNIMQETNRFSTDIVRSFNETMTAIERTVQNASNPILNQFRTLFQSIISETNTFVTNFTNAISNLFNGVMQQVNTFSTNFANGISSALTSAANVVSNSSGINNAFRGMFNTVLGTTETFANNLVSGIRAAVVQSANILMSLPNAATITVPAASTVNIPRLATGHPFIPYDDFPAFLHKGERVLTAAENAEYSDGGDSSEAQMATNALLKQAVKLLSTIADKDLSVVLGDRDIHVAAQRGARQQGFPIYPDGDNFALNH